MTTRLRSRLVPAAAIIVAASFFLPLGSASVANADPISDQRQRVEQLTDELERLGEQADALAEELAVATSELRELETQVADAEQAVAEQTAAVTELQGELSEVAVAAYLGAGTGGLGPMFSSTADYTDALQRAEMSRAALSSGTATSDDLERELNALAEEQAALETARESAEEQQAAVEAAHEATETKTAEYNEARDAAEAELGQLIAEEEERRARESYERMLAEAAAAEAEAAAAADRQRQEQQQQQQQSSSGSSSSSSSSSTSSSSATATSSSSSSGSSSSSSASSGASSGGGGGGGSAAPPPASTKAGTAVSAANSQLGVPYRWATASPGHGFDCSGLTSWAWGRAGVSLPHQSARQAAMLPGVSQGSAQPGDLIFYYNPVSHVGIYIGGGQMVHAPNTGSVVHVTSVNWGNVVKVGRPG